MVSISTSGNQIVIQFPYNQQLVEAVKKIPGRRWRPEEKVWVAPDSITTRAFISHYLTPVTYDKSRPPVSQIPFSPKVPSFRHQTVMTNSIYGAFLSHRGLGLFAETGTGKTKAVLDFLVNMPGRHLVVCPAPLLKVWQEQSAQFLGEDIFAVIHGHGRKFPSKQNDWCALTSYGTFSNDIDFWKEVELATIFYDESHLLKSASTLRFKAARKVNCPCRVLMTGTPYGNEYIDFWSQMYLVNPNALGTKEVFMDAYCEFGGWENKEVVGYKNTDLMIDIIKCNAVVVKKDECLDLPPKMYQTVNIPMEPKCREVYDRAKRGGLEDEPISGEMAIIGKLRQISSGFYYIGDRTERVGAHKATYLSSINWDSPTIIWYNFDAERDEICSVLSHLGVSHVTTEKAYDAAKQFNEEKVQVLVAQMKTLQYGYTLNRASRVIYYSGCFSALERSQSEDRCHRIGQNKSVLYVDVISSEIEVWMKEAVSGKRDVLEYILEKLQNNT